MKIFLLSFFFSSAVFALCETYTKYGEPLSICWNKEFKALLSEKCQEPCEATNFLKKKNSRPSKIDRSGGKNPATQFCKAFELNVFVLKDPRGGEQSFCGFPDGSLIDSNAFSRSLK